MNYKMIRFVISWVLKVEGMLMLFPALVGAMYQEKTGFAYLIWGLLCIAAGLILCFRKPSNMEIYSRDGFVCVSLSWVVLGVFGAVPFVITGEIPFYINALFEIVSGFTTTGASILSDVEALSHASLFWRSFSHWIGGMGVLVFILALLPMKGGSVMNLMKAESPGPTVSKFVPRVRGTAKILYQIYLGMTLFTIAALLLSGMKTFDSVTLAMGAAGTGGFAVLNSGCAVYTPLQQWILTIAMIAFGVNFNFYYLMLCKKGKAAISSQEVRAYFLIILLAGGVISWNTYPMYHSIGETVRTAFFQVGSIITTTGYSTTDFDLWPELSKCILVMLMFIGACAGSTGGGIKSIRVLILFKEAKRNIRKMLRPRSVSAIHVDGAKVDDEVVHGVHDYLTVYTIISIASLLLIAIDNFSMETSLTAVLACLNNIGPGLDLVGPMGNYACFSAGSKLILSLDMLIGRLEIFPMLMLAVPVAWKR